MGNVSSSSRNREKKKCPRIIILNKESKSKKGDIAAPEPVVPPEDKMTKKEPIVLPLEVIMEILSWLPVKNFTRAQLVCREWGELIQDHQLKRSNMNRSPHRHLWYNVYRAAAPDPEAPRQTTTYLHGCDGLLLMRNNTTFLYFLWNPAAKLLLQLPTSPHTDRCGTTLSFARATRHFKIASFFKDTKTRKLGCELLTLGLSPMEWRRLEIPQEVVTTNEQVSVVPAGGVPHCIVVRMAGNENAVEIVSLDVETELLTLNRLPGGVFRDVGAATAIDCNGKLGFGVVDKQELQVVVLQDFKKGRWCRNKEVIPLPFLRDEGYEGRNVVVLFIKEGEVWFLLEDEKVFVYTVETGEIRDEVKKKGISLCSVLHDYKPSMITFEGMRADDELAIYRPSFL